MKILILYSCSECKFNELLAGIIPKKTCEKCGVLMQADED